MARCHSWTYTRTHCVIILRASEAAAQCIVIAPVCLFVFYLRAVGRQVLWSAACVCLCVCVSVCLCASARYLKNGFMDHDQIWWVGAGGEPLDKV